MSSHEGSYFAHVDAENTTQKLNVILILKRLRNVATVICDHVQPGENKSLVGCVGEHIHSSFNAAGYAVNVVHRDRQLVEVLGLFQLNIDKSVIFINIQPLCVGQISEQRTELGRAVTLEDASP